MSPTTSSTRPPRCACSSSPCPTRAPRRPTPRAAPRASSSRRPGHVVAGYRLLKDEPAEVAALIRTHRRRALGRRRRHLGRHRHLARATRPTRRSTSLLDKRLDGFGELFRMLSYDEIGSAAMMSRAVAGLHRGVVVFATPGSTAAVQAGAREADPPRARPPRLRGAPMSARSLPVLRDGFARASATCASRSPIAATIAASTACPKRASTWCPSADVLTLRGDRARSCA